MEKIIYNEGDMVLLKNDTVGKVCYDVRGARAVELQDENGNKITVEITKKNPVIEILESI